MRPARQLSIATPCRSSSPVALQHTVLASRTMVPLAWLRAPAKQLQPCMLSAPHPAAQQHRRSARAPPPPRASDGSEDDLPHFGAAEWVKLVPRPVRRAAQRALHLRARLTGGDGSVALAVLRCLDNQERLQHSMNELHARVLQFEKDTSARLALFEKDTDGKIEAIARQAAAQDAFCLAAIAEAQRINAEARRVNAELRAENLMLRAMLQARQ